MRPAELDKARAVAAALQASPEARKLLRHGKKERTIIQPRQPGLLPLKARLDIHHEAKRQIVELKTTWNLAAVQTTMERYRYPLSAAFYRDLVRGRSVVFVFVETTPPYEIAVLPMEQSATASRTGAMAIRPGALRSVLVPERMARSRTRRRGLDDDPLLMDLIPVRAAARPRFELPVGELAL